MNQIINIGIIGDFDEKRRSHLATNTTIEHAAQHLAVDASITWLPTPALLTVEGLDKLEQFDAVWASPGSPYQSMEGAIRGIQLAREMNLPFVGT